MDDVSILMQRMKSFFAFDPPSTQSHLLTTLGIIRHGHVIDKDNFAAIFDCHADLVSMPVFSCTYRNNNNSSLSIVFNNRSIFNESTLIALDGVNPTLIESIEIGNAFEYRCNGVRIVAVIIQPASELVSLFAEKIDKQHFS